MDKRKIKIVRIINRFNLGGPTYNATFLTRFISDEFETILVGGVHDEGETDSLHILDEYGVTPIIIPELKRNPSAIQDKRAYKKIKDIIEIEKPDIVHTHASKAGLLGRRAAKACDVPVVVHTFHGHVFHSYFNKLKTVGIKFLERNLAKSSDGIIAISELQKKELSETHKICSADKIEVIPLGFDLNKFTTNKVKGRFQTREKLGIDDDTIAIAIIGRLAPVKNHDFFLKVIKRLLTKTDKKVKAFIVGDGMERENIERRVNAINQKHGEVIVMTSWVLDVASFNHGMDIICLTSKNEGTPVSLIEAQTAEIPVVTTDVGGIKDIVINEKTGFVIKNRDLETYTDKLRLLVENEQLRDEMGKKGHENVIKKFHYSRLVDDMELYYKKLLKDKT